jgi:hypothetical protein
LLVGHRQACILLLPPQHLEARHSRDAPSPDDEAGGDLRFADDLDGYLARHVPPMDSRPVRLGLTGVGRDQAAEARAYQREVFRQVTSDWAEDEREAFARLFVRFAAAVLETMQRAPVPSRPEDR